MASVFDRTPPQEGRVGYVVTKGVTLDTYTIHRNCPFCGQGAHVNVSGEGLWQWEHGTKVQDAFPTLSADDREMIHTGIHPACWDNSFPEED